ncbi:hypothetical protein [Riemerella anatipestifer]|uniref:hypothetical protein n=1 Tax=Riemerella anatipestifer TaxID=34085 RepID=UPI0013736373|nr:hypothetical protein [Riemerella anatipestifer]MBO4233909.1 hypothetical protein [Riemerella anatipestifer]MBT0550253.1 hypothetical protein [Riemerella anatipestifer]MBT0556977.1 hypothetical protein [Riemerella anatipestifer]MBT0561013.1 hypothetical protein [Riemerella anatipestifer]NAV17316.1 hypothetical protein [Riemerella anatipestifer]
MPKDILLDDNMDLMFSGGDFSVGDSTYQHQQILIFSDKGEFKQFPNIGVGSRRYLESERPDEFAREIRQQFIADGMKVEEIKIEEDLTLNINAHYES